MKLCLVENPVIRTHKACANMPEMVSYDTAQALLAATLCDLPPIGMERVPTALASGRILAEDVHALTPRPEADISAMDGYAFRSYDMRNAGDIGLPIVGHVAAGDRPVPLSEGTACLILTGARIPEGADCVMARERTHVIRNRVTLTDQTARVGLNIRREGEEFPLGQCLLQRDQSLDWRHIPLLLSQGITDVSVYRPITVSVLANGAEFASQAEDAREELNTHMLAAMLRSDTVHVTRQVAASDREEELRNALLHCVEQSDVIVTTGGISVGQTDHVLSVLLQLGASCVFRRVSMRPGKPMTVMRLGRKIVFCLPGNPGAAALCAQLFVIPFLKAMILSSDLPHSGLSMRGRSTFAYTPPQDATCFLPVSILQEAGAARFHIVPSVGSSDILCLTRADGIMRIDAGQSVQVGDWSEMLPFTGLRL
ncbi:MAG: molybdopterin molybdotransferase MoeA [Acetobacter sp.]